MSNENPDSGDKRSPKRNQEAVPERSEPLPNTPAGNAQYDAELESGDDQVNRGKRPPLPKELGGWSKPRGVKDVPLPGEEGSVDDAD